MSVDSSSLGILVNIIQNYTWVDGVNYALNLAGYSNFGGIQKNGQDTKYIHKRVGDLTVASPSINNILFKTNGGHWETMRLNPDAQEFPFSYHILKLPK